MDPVGASHDGLPTALGPLPPRLARWSMNTLYAVLVVVLFPYALFRFVTDHKTRSRWRAYNRDLRARYVPRRPREGKRPCVWIHGVSVGEVKSVAQLIEAIEGAFPEVEQIVSVSTDTGRRVALERYAGHRVEFYPPDLSWIVDDALDALRPDVIVLVESGFWPNFLGIANERGIPLIVVNGRMSARSWSRYRLVRGLIGRVLSRVAELCVQLPIYGERFVDLGVSSDHVHVTGNMKFDNIPVERKDLRLAAFQSLFGREDGPPLVVAGSTHPGEERALARIRRALREQGHDFRLLLAPRHPARADHVCADIEREGFQVVRRSELEGPPDPDAVILLDTVGELENAYTLADCVYVGGTLVRHGGQNMMEPASLGCPVVVGPYVDNFRGEVDMLLKAGGLVLVADEAGVRDTIAHWLAHPEEARDLGRRARQAIIESKGATQRTFEVVEPYLARAVEKHAARRA